MLNSSVPGRVSPKRNLVDDLKKTKKTKKLPSLDPIDPVFKPFCTYFHFLVKRTEETPATQTFEYVEWAFDLLIEHGLLNQIENLTIWSDGCGKHFKTYNTHFGIAEKQQDRPETKFRWRFLAPNKAHNRADAAAAHLSVSISKLIQNFNLMSDLGHLAFANSKLTRSIMIEADFADFPPTRDTSQLGEAFMRTAFDFEYLDFGVETIVCILSLQHD